MQDLECESSQENKSLFPLLRRLGYRFNDLNLLNLALTHRSYSSKNNERLEFLGDSVINFVVASILYTRFPDADEGQLSLLRSQLVKGITLAQLARELGLVGHLRLGFGEKKSGGQNRNSILSDVMESIIGAIYLDGGLAKCQGCIFNWLDKRLQVLSINNSTKDPKTLLQELLQARKINLPIYTVKKIIGADHAQEFIVECRIDLFKNVVVGDGSSRRMAEQMAASRVLSKLEQEEY